MMRTKRLIALASMTAVALASNVRADDRRFTYIDEARVTPKGGFEFEQWVTWKHGKPGNSDYNNFQFKEELEYGLGHNLMLGFEIPEWHFKTGPSGQKQGPRFDAVAAEIRGFFTDPVNDPIGLGGKFEVALGEDEFVLEGRAIVQKNFDKVEFAYNFNLEARWVSTDEARYSEREGEISNRLGVSYEFVPKFFAGAELLHEAPLPDWKTGENQNLFVGPNFSFHSTNWAITTTPLFRVSKSEDEPRFQWRLIFEVDF